MWRSAITWRTTDGTRKTNMETHVPSHAYRAWASLWNSSRFCDDERAATMSSRLRMVPVTRDVARPFIEEHHSHHHAPRQAVMWCAVEADGELVCVGCLERPKARHTASDPRAAEITRIASSGSHKNAASKCIAGISRAAIALGYTRLVSYTLLGEAGTSYRAAGWWVTGIVPPRRSWSATGRHRAPATQPGSKVRWEFGSEARVEDIDTKKVMDESVGKVDIPRKSETLPLPLFTGQPQHIDEGRR